MRQVHNLQEEYQCEACGQSLFTKALLNRHVYMKHSTETRYKCSFCFRGFKTNNGLKSHVYTHDANQSEFKCEMCGKKCRDKATLGYHINTHTGEKPFKCKHCDYAAASYPLLNIHRAKCKSTSTSMSTRKEEMAKRPVWHIFKKIDS